MSEIMKVLEIIGTIAFAVSGALVAIGAGLDIFGVVFVGCITAVGGGIVRDILLGISPPSIFTNFPMFLLALLTTIVVFLVAFVNRKRFFELKNKIEHINNIFDALGLAVFTVIGAEAGYINGFSDNGFIIVSIGMITGIGGGIFRDILTDTTPYVLKKHVYALATILGAILYVILKRCFDNITLISILPMLLVFLIRLFATIFHWSLPKIHIENKD